MPRPLASTPALLLGTLLGPLLGAVGAVQGQAFDAAWSEPAADRWNYGFNATPGTRNVASVFGYTGDLYDFDERDGQVIIVFDTADQIDFGFTCSEALLKGVQCIRRATAHPDTIPVIAGVIIEPVDDVAVILTSFPLPVLPVGTEAIVELSAVYRTVPFRDQMSDIPVVILFELLLRVVGVVAVGRLIPVWVRGQEVVNIQPSRRNECATGQLQV